MDLELEQKLRPQLTAGERLLWSGKPAEGPRLQASDAILIPFSVMWAGFAFFWEYSVLQIPKTNPAAYFMPIWGIPFVCIGLYLLIGRFFWDALVRSHTSYGLTDKRAIIFTDFMGSKVNSVQLRNTMDVSLKQNSVGLGTITFGSASPFTNFGFRNWPSGRRTPALPAFEMIPDASRVYGMIQDAQQKAN